MFFLFGTSAEFTAGKEIMRGKRLYGVLNKTENLAGATGLIELSEKISKLDRLLTPDASALGGPSWGSGRSLFFCLRPGLTKPGLMARGTGCGRRFSLVALP